MQLQGTHAVSGHVFRVERKRGPAVVRQVQAWAEADPEAPYAAESSYPRMRL
jgi:hypothetical protein